MPIYEYACTACGERTEAKQGFADLPLEDCPRCGGRLRKLYSPVGIVFKGSGFYSTDARKEASKKSSAASEGGSGAEKGAGAEKGSGSDRGGRSEKGAGAEKGSGSDRGARSEKGSRKDPADKRSAATAETKRSDPPKSEKSA